MSDIDLSTLWEQHTKDFIPSMPPDMALTPISRTLGEDQLVDEMIFFFTQSTATRVRSRSRPKRSPFQLNAIRDSAHCKAPLSGFRAVRWKTPAQR